MARRDPPPFRVPDLPCAAVRSDPPARGAGPPIGAMVAAFAIAVGIAPPAGAAIHKRSGADGATFCATKLRAPEKDLGYEGEVGRTDVRLVDLLLRDGFLPVIATAAPLQAGEDAPGDRFYNVNADLAAGPLSRAVRADALLFLTDVPAVLDAGKQRIPELTPGAAASLRLAGVIHGGMIPKSTPRWRRWPRIPARSSRSRRDRLFSYKNIYFDTPEFSCYTAHHNKRVNRYKIRIRQYVESNLNFLEVKFKINTGRTIKSRIKIQAFDPEFTPEAKAFLSTHTPFDLRRTQAYFVE